MRPPEETGHVVQFRKGLFGLIAKGFWKIPEVMAASIMGIVGIGLATAGVMRYIENDGDNREFRSTYYIVRSGDPRECTMKNPVFTSAI